MKDLIYKKYIQFYTRKKIMSNYILEVISHHPDFAGKPLRQYDVDGIKTIGAYGSEEFSIRFRNMTWQKVQLILSLDGTCILSGKPATTEANSKDMWVVDAYGTLELKAFPETRDGGAAFVFTSADNSVALHTHGNMSSRGIIAAAVFTEGHIPEPVYIKNIHHTHYYPWYPYQTLPYWYGYPTYSGVTYTASSPIICDTNSGGKTFSSSTINAAALNNLNTNNSDATIHNSLQSQAAVGAGQYVNQKIAHVAGLIKPVLSETIRIRYLWWDDLVSKLKQNNVAAPHASGFPGDKEKLMSLGNTPRLGVPRPVNSVPQPVSYSRV